MANEAFLSQPSYQLFRQALAEKKAPLVIVCGSGLSAPAKLPTWPQLRHTLELEAEAKDRALNEFGKKLISPTFSAAKSQENPWVAFKLLKEYLTRPVFENLVERELTPDENAQIPEGYTELMRLSPRGVVTLNLDKFAGEALAKEQGSALITPVYGTELAQKWNLIKSARTFLVYLHGGIHDPLTWVLTQDELSVLTHNPGHAYFLSTVFTDHLVLFAGVGVDDAALSTKLLDLSSAGFNPRNLYWLTSRVDPKLEKWTQDSRVSIINYAARTSDEHTDAIRLLVEDCLKYVSRDTLEPPLSGTSIGQFAEPLQLQEDPDELAQQSPEQIRKTVSILLNRALSTASSEQEAFSIYRAFCEKYDFAVDRSFYRGKAERFRNWFDYKLEGSPIGQGNFGEVYSAQSPDGNLVAIKIMHKNIFGNDDMLGGFRRGVRSMQIITDESIPGMVPIVASFELPPTIIMPYVGGLSLEDVVRTRPDLPWMTKLGIAVRIGEIVGAGHALPQTVLHRDLKPSNIMVTNMEYEGSFDPDVVVLDFDMSWHKGSKEKDVVFESRDDFGYLAPEQTDISSRYAARSTRVDSYGFGMTVYYLFGGDAPRPNEALSDLWLSRAIRAAARDYHEGWRSAAARLGRLISRATQIDQNIRIDFASMTHELKSIQDAIIAPDSLDNVELWAEEVMSILADEKVYEWDDAVGKGVLRRPGGLAIEISSNFRKGSVDLAIRYLDQGDKERASVGKYLANAVTSVDRALEKGGWLVEERRVAGMEAIIAASVTVSKLKAARKDIFEAAGDVLSAFRF